MDLAALFAGLGLGLSLIVAIGAQNLFVLRQGIRREHVFAVAAICAVSDLTLIIVGVSGIGAILIAVPWLVEAIRWAGAAFLVVYGLLAAKRAWKPSGEALAVEQDVDEASVLANTAPAASAAIHARAESAIQEESPTRRGPGSDTPEHRGEVPESRTGAGSDTARPAGVAGRTSLRAAILTCLALTWLNPHVYLDTVFLLGSVANTHGDDRWVFALGASLASIIWFFGLAYGARGLGRWLSGPRAWRILDAIIAVVMVALGVSLVLPH
ncbi:LysE/ArgO family amino acid transporter [Agromyces agglutinans]|uniref:LysE/ArgO family amino acid transporter n=1 Tax=Agromyces agglutinans TaxID=2662258 RepID=UPI0028B0E7DB|nr:LysE/ArgO family amino acid transporter [Agromyces agglutinans]